MPNLVMKEAAVRGQKVTGKQGLMGQHSFINASPSGLVKRILIAAASVL